MKCKKFIKEEFEKMVNLVIGQHQSFTEGKHFEETCLLNSEACKRTLV